MDTFISFAARKSSGVVGPIISLALVFGGSAAFAERLSGMSPSADAGLALIGSFSDSDLAELEHSSAAEATTARLAALGAPVPSTAKVRSRPAAPGDAVQIADADLFPHSARVMPLLVALPQTDGAEIRTVAGPRLGSVRPVGVPASSLRSPTPSERTGR